MLKWRWVLIITKKDVRIKVYPVWDRNEKNEVFQASYIC